MTLQNLSKILDKYDKRDQLGTTETQQFRRLKGLPFYNFLNHNDINTFNYIIGLPTKGGLEFPLFDYEHL